MFLFVVEANNDFLNQESSRIKSAVEPCNMEMSISPCRCECDEAILAPGMPGAGASQLTRNHLHGKYISGKHVLATDVEMD